MCTSYINAPPSLSKTFTDLLNTSETNAHLAALLLRESEWHVICHNRRTSSHHMGWQELCCHSNPHAFPAPWVGRLTHSMREKTLAHTTNIHMHSLTRRRWHLTLGPPWGKPLLETDVTDERLFQNSTIAISCANHCNNESMGDENRMSSSKKANQVWLAGYICQTSCKCRMPH